jgi:hypothetical protein
LEQILLKDVNAFVTKMACDPLTSKIVTYGKDQGHVDIEEFETILTEMHAKIEYLKTLSEEMQEREQELKRAYDQALAEFTVNENRQHIFTRSTDVVEGISVVDETVSELDSARRNQKWTSFFS